MFWHKKTFVTWCLIIGLIMLPFAALAASIDAYEKEAKTSPEVMSADLILVRPLGLVATVCGSVVFLVSSPFSAMGGNIEEAWDRLVVKPATYTFQRPLGHFEE